MQKKKKQQIDGAVIAAWIAGAFVLLSALITGFLQIDSVRNWVDELVSGGYRCPPEVGEAVHLESNARLWTEPDVFVGDVARVLDGDGLDVYVIEDPVMGVVNRSMPDVLAAWWRVRAKNGEELGWTWQGNMKECIK